MNAEAGEQRFNPGELSPETKVWLAREAVRAAVKAARDNITDSDNLEATQGE